MSNHTPGPWRSVRLGSESYVQAKNSHVVCNMDRNSCADECEAYVCDANARLIASAPVLLAAAKRALKAIEDLPPRYNEDRYEPLMMLSTAIAKAEGKA